MFDFITDAVEKINSKYFKIKKETIINDVVVIDERMIKSEITSIPIVGEENSYRKIMVNAAFNSKKPVCGSVDDEGKITIK